MVIHNPLAIIRFEFYRNNFDFFTSIPKKNEGDIPAAYAKPLLRECTLNTYIVIEVRKEEVPLADGRYLATQQETINQR